LNHWSCTWQAKYNAACFYSLAAREGQQRTNNGKQVLDAALERLTGALNDPQSQLTSGWLCADPDLETLRNDSRGALVREQCREGAPSSEVRQRIVRRLRLAWSLLAKGAGRRQAVWKSRKAEAARWTGVQGRDLEAWCQEEVEAWGRLVHWAAKPEDRGRQEQFWKILLKPNEEEELPTLEPLDEDTEGNEQKYRAAWQSLVECATAQRDHWDHLENVIRHWNEAGSSQAGPSGATDMAEAAQECWLSLRDWAEGPLDSNSRAAFLAKADCEELGAWFGEIIAWFTGASD
jgi:hypothetical protein